MNPSELEFLAEDEPIQIIPRFKMEAIQLFPYSVGPFFPNVVITTPMWVALFLRQQQKCRIIPPDWLTVEKLSDCKEAEESESGCSQPPHRQYMELANLLLQHAPEDLQNPESIRTIIRDLWDIRVRKLVSSVNAFVSSGVPTAGVSRLTQLELTTLRKFLCSSMDQLFTLRQVASETSLMDQSRQTFLDSTSMGL